MKRPSKLLSTTKANGFGGLRDGQHQLIAILLLNPPYPPTHTNTHTLSTTFSRLSGAADRIMIAF